MKKLMCLFLVVIFCANAVLPISAIDIIDGNAVVSTDYDIDHYTYPITLESEDWFDYSVMEKVEMLRIPQEILSRMTSSALITAIEEYPYLVDIYLYGIGPEDGVDVSRSYFSALDELLSREDGIADLMAYCADALTATASLQNTVTDDAIGFELTALMDIVNSVSENVASPAVVLPTTSYVLTPNGSRVMGFLYIEEHTRAEHQTYDISQIVNVYGVTLVEPGSCVYNCHHFAWYLNGDYANDELSKLWINNPSPYMTDGSYTRVYSGTLNTLTYSTNIRNGDIIFYGNLSDSGDDWHSAIYIADAVTGAPISTQMCISKWGKCGVFRHTMGNVPAAYNTSSISAWRLS